MDEESGEITSKHAADPLNIFVTFTESSNAFKDTKIINLHILRNKLYRKWAK